MAETRIDLNTGFSSGDNGVAHISKIALHTSTPAALTDDSGPLKRKITEPDEFPRVDLSVVAPYVTGDIDVAHPYPHEGKTPPEQDRMARKGLSDGKSLTA